MANLLRKFNLVKNKILSRSRYKFLHNEAERPDTHDAKYTKYFYDARIRGRNVSIFPTRERHRNIS